MLVVLQTRSDLRSCLSIWRCRQASDGLQKPFFHPVRHHLHVNPSRDLWPCDPHMVTVGGSDSIPTWHCLNRAPAKLLQVKYEVQVGRETLQREPPELETCLFHDATLGTAPGVPLVKLWVHNVPGWGGLKAERSPKLWTRQFLEVFFRTFLCHLY